MSTHKQRRRRTRRGNPRRRRRIDIGAVSKNVVWISLAGIGIYFLYQLISGITQKNPGNQAYGGGSLSPIDQFVNTLFPISFPGGGQVPGSSETYTGAAFQTILHPWDTLVTLFGGTPNTTGGLYYGPNTPNTPGSSAVSAQANNTNPLSVFLGFNAVTYGPNDVIPGTGQTLNQLRALGYQDSDITTTLQQNLSLVYPDTNGLAGYRRRSVAC